MKVLWLSNVLFPEVCQELNLPIPVVGGWLYSGAKALLEQDATLELSVLAFYFGQEIKQLKINEIQYFCIPDKFAKKQKRNKLKEIFQQIKRELSPDVIHIHGTEYSHSLLFVQACGSQRVVVSIQGLISVISDYYLGGITRKEIWLNTSLKDIIKNDNLIQQQNRLVDKGKDEKLLIKSVQHVIGRTNWDLSHCIAINPNLNYHKCNESLRPVFYNQKWTYNNCRKNSIFISQSHYPLKGIQQLIKALPIVLDNFPDAMVYVVGTDFINLPWFRKNGFMIYLEKLLRKYKVIDKFVFLGTLGEQQMVEQYLAAHVFVCPSSIENSSNSIGEAQLIGTPCVVSYVGGNMDMVKDGETGFLYRFEEKAMLAKRICDIFESRELAETFSENERKVAALRHDKRINAEYLLKIYQQILNENVYSI